jgi:hypothetical protein
MLFQGTVHFIENEVIFGIVTKELAFVPKFSPHHFKGLTIEKADVFAFAHVTLLEINDSSNDLCAVKK